jgi:hypothetical protein
MPVSSRGCQAHANSRARLHLPRSYLGIPGFVPETRPLNCTGNVAERAQILDSNDSYEPRRVCPRGVLAHVTASKTSLSSAD